ncbi:BadF/BadG/BcrA/BcrD ATPase family protein [Lactococcus petauri]|uniref:BadF/BadG/BcrA/BcrD ATPase family protein n=1 Tax=Lactococcus petauri TaxID=1940789 RepID=UPI00254EF280|nr:BadF/BadG/BcrA/BcrD ATPase family protein [Lactococcus petauri]
MKIIIGVDAGGTKTEAVAYDRDGNSIAQAYSSFRNVLIDFAAACQHIQQAIKRCLNVLPDAELVALSLGVAGVGSGKYNAELQQALSSFGVPIRIETDARIAHAAYFPKGDGILTIAGTGAVSFGHRGEKQVMTGGWGHLIGADRGSGYWIALQAIEKMANDEDQGKPLSQLSNAILHYLNLPDSFAIKRFVYGAPKKELAALTPIIVAEANKDSFTAQNILREAGQFLAQITIDNYNKLDRPQDIGIALKGSVLLKIPQVQTTFIQEVKKFVPTASIITEEVSSTKGAFYLALAEL